MPVPQITVAEFVKRLRAKNVKAGDVVHFRRKQHFVYEVRDSFIVIVSMDERKMFLTLYG